MDKNKPYIITLSGKGGVGKTTLTALLLDELARCGYAEPVLVVDGDPASTLHLALGIPRPKITVANVRDRNRSAGKVMRELPRDIRPKDVLGEEVARSVLTHHILRGMPVDFLTMGHHESRGCYCNINRTLGQVVKDLLDNYSLVIMDNEAGLEHLNRYRIEEIDCLLVVANPSPASRQVALDILDLAHRLRIVSGQSVFVLNRALPNGNGKAPGVMSPVIPAHADLQSMEARSEPVVGLSDTHPVRLAVRDDLMIPLLSPILECVPVMAD